MFSALRRRRVARWSSRNRSDSVSGSSVRSSRWSIWSSCRVIRFCVRRPRLTNTSLTLRRNVACSAARPTAVRCTALKASVSSPSSSRLGARSGTATSSAASGPLLWATATARGRTSRATAWAADVRSRIGRTTRRWSRIARTARRARAAAPSTSSSTRVRSADAPRASAVLRMSEPTSSASAASRSTLRVVDVNHKLPLSGTGAPGPSASTSERRRSVAATEGDRLASSYPAAPRGWRPARTAPATCPRARPPRPHGRARRRRGGPPSRP